MNDEADHYNAFLEIHAGAGGTESQDWAEMLQRMYIRWAESQNNCKVTLFQESRGEEAGIKSCIIKISMFNCLCNRQISYTWLSNNTGVIKIDF